MLQSPPVEREQYSPSPDSGLFDAFIRRFDVIPADTPALQEKAYRLRYQVYCCENQYENPDENLQEMEMDAFDERSIHSLIVDRATGLAVGTVRLIFPDLDPHKDSFPVQHICHHPLPNDLSLSSTVEISRFAISKKMRRMADGDKTVNCSIILGLMRALVQMSLEYGITDWLAVMEPSLLRLLGRFGIEFAPLGPLVEYHGVRQPCHINFERLLEQIRQDHFDLWEFVTEPNESWSAEKVS